MKKIKSIFMAVMLAAATLAAVVSCKSDSADNPVFGKGEIYIYTNLPQAITVTVGQPQLFNMKVSPANGSVDCRWLLDGTLIADTPEFEYIFYTAGVFTLRFEAEKDGVVNYRQFNLTVVEE